MLLFILYKKMAVLIILYWFRQAKEVIKALKKRLQHKNANVQFLALTVCFSAWCTKQSYCVHPYECSEIAFQLLETLIKNCGDHVHVQVIERNILEEMMKIVKKKVSSLCCFMTFLGFKLHTPLVCVREKHNLQHFSFYFKKLKHCT